ncbi:E3 ubiquitin-protein ligase MIB2-like [Pomacea canaliculata]|uniref:E3 ubiquitin-protein ligase MIB2-like n=1 Tax=Pomacea canaliculata TaxID=400727 RepID=UPI000D73632B|nr:E3 ubiquitin-protein ligase MIB2-like [Pomacea canaliculata]
MWNDQDGGQSSEGVVEGFEPEAVDSWRNLVRVRWPNGVLNSYRLGFKDLTHKEATRTAGPSHGPRPTLVLRPPGTSSLAVENTGTVMAKGDSGSNSPSTARPGADRLVVGPGDHVTIAVDEHQLKILQKNFGGCTLRMMRSIGSRGAVTSTMSGGAVCVRFGPHKALSYRFNPAALIKLQTFRENDTVRVKSSKELTRLFNREIGWTTEMNETLGKVGQVRKVDHEGNLVVEVEGQVFRYSPACCLHEPESVTSHCEETVRQEMTSMKIRSRITVRSIDLWEVDRELSADSGVESRAHAMQTLYLAIGDDDDTRVKELCQLDPYLVQCEFTETKPLILAVHEGRRRCVRALLELGADVSGCVSNHPGRNPMSAAIEGGHEDLVELLLELGANKEHWYSPGITAIHMAVHKDLPGAVMALAKHGADVNKKNVIGSTALHMAIDLRKTDIVEALLSLPEVDIEIEDGNYFNALQLACLKNIPRAVELILERNKSILNKTTKGGTTVLQIASHNNHVECVRLLVINVSG